MTYYTLATIRPALDALREEGKVLVLVTGFFDLLHIEHIRFLKKAKAAGDVLIVGVESDRRARELKGPGRPIMSQEERGEMLASLSTVDFILMLPEDFSRQVDYEQLMETVRPHVLAVSSHTAHLKNKRGLAEKHGGSLKVVHVHNPLVSTTLLLQQLGLPRTGKLVRDRIPDLIRAAGKTCEVATLSIGEYRQALRYKLLEEAMEAVQAKGGAYAEELVDILEVSMAVAVSHSLPWEEVEKKRQQKARERGSFKKRLFLVSVKDEAR